MTDEMQGWEEALIWRTLRDKRDRLLRVEEIDPDAPRDCQAVCVVVGDPGTTVYLSPEEIRAAR